MKLKIEKLDNGKIRVELTTDTKKAPSAFDLTADQIEQAYQMLSMAARTTHFRVEILL